MIIEEYLTFLIGGDWVFSLNTDSWAANLLKGRVGPHFGLAFEGYH